MDISYPQAKILDAQGYNERVKVPCYQNPGIELDAENQANTMNSIVSCNNEHLYKNKSQPLHTLHQLGSQLGQRLIQLTGVESLSSFQQNI